MSIVHEHTIKPFNESIVQQILGEGRGKNLAFAKPTHQGTNYGDQTSERAVDGNVFTRSVTYYAELPFWAVDLGHKCLIDVVRIVIIPRGKVSLIHDPHSIVWYCFQVEDNF